MHKDLEYWDRIGYVCQLGVEVAGAAEMAPVVPLGVGGMRVCRNDASSDGCLCKVEITIEMMAGLWVQRHQGCFWG